MYKLKYSCSAAGIRLEYVINRLLPIIFPTQLLLFLIFRLTMSFLIDDEMVYLLFS